MKKLQLKEVIREIIKENKKFTSIKFTPYGEKLNDKIIQKFNEYESRGEEYWEKATPEELFIQDLSIYIDGGYAGNNFKNPISLKKWALKTAKEEYENDDYNKVLNKIYKGINKGYITIE